MQRFRIYEHTEKITGIGEFRDVLQSPIEVKHLIR